MTIITDKNLPPLRERSLRKRHALQSCLFLGVLLVAWPAQADPPKFAVDIPLAESVVIDGKADDWADCGYRMDVLEPMGGQESRPEGQRVEARLAWNRAGLLLLVSAWDNAWMESALSNRLYEGDSVETFLYSSGASNGGCQWVFSPGMDAAQPEARSQFFDKRETDALRILPAGAAVARTRVADTYVMEMLLPWSALAIEPKTGTEAQFWFWVNDRDGRVDDMKRVCRNRFTLRLADKAPPPQQFLHWTIFNARAMLSGIAVQGGALNVGKPVELVCGGKTLARGEFARDSSGYAVVELLVPERGAGTPPYAELVALVDGREAFRVAAPDPARGRAETFLFSSMAATPGSVFQGTTFPAIDFEEPSKIVTAVGRYSLKTTYYNSRFKAVDQASEPGRYGAVVEVAVPGGRSCRRFFTLFRQPDDRAWKEAVKGRTTPGGKGAGPAVELAGMYAAQPGGSPDTFYDSPAQKDRQWWVDFKRKFYGLDRRWPRPFVCPRPKEGAPAPVLREGSLHDAGMKPGTDKRIDEVLARWAADSDEPFAVCVARHGVIVLHKAYGMKDGRPMTVDDPGFLASLTKLLSGTLLLELADQGLVELDAPVADYLPPFASVRSAKQLTVRHLYTHTSGFEWHWGGMENDLEERLAFHMPNVRVGERFMYNGTGFDLGSKVLEAVSGESLPNLHRRHLLDPLGCRNTRILDGGGSAWSVPLDMARIGQMLLNKGAYGKMVFMKEQTFDRILPARLTKVLGPGAADVYGLGAMWFTDEGLGSGTFAHGAKSMATLRIDPQNDLVICMTRDRPGRNFVTYHQQFLNAITAGLQAEK